MDRESKLSERTIALVVQLSSDADTRHCRAQAGIIIFEALGLVVHREDDTARTDATYWILSTLFPRAETFSEP